MTKGLQWRVTLVLVLVFFAGLASGLFAGAFHARHVFVGRHGPSMAGRMREHLRHELRLTPEQFGKIAPVIDRSAEQLELIRRETSSRVAATMEASSREIVPLLTSEQRERLDRMREKHQRMRRGHDFADPPD